MDRQALIKLGIAEIIISRAEQIQNLLQKERRVQVKAIGVKAIRAL